jgi:hypothetical protein
VFDTDILLTIAEIAVAFAGFASIAGALGNRYSNLDPRVNSLRLYNMVDIALTVVVISLVPIFFSQVIGSERILWMVSSGLSLIVGGSAFIRISNRAKPMSELEGYQKKGAQKVRVAAVIGLLGLLIGTTGLAAQYAYAIYLGSLLLVLLASGMLFLRVVHSIFYLEKEGS